MKNKNTRAIVLRAGLALSMLFGAGLHADHVSAEEAADVSAQEEASSEEIPAVDISQEVSAEEQVENNEAVEEATGEEPLEEADPDSEDKEESKDSENLHNEEASADEEVDASKEAAAEEEASAEEVLEEAEEAEADADAEKVEKKEAELEAMTLLTADDHSEEDLINVDRIYGQNRFKNAVEISKKGWETASKVFLANGHKYADALTGSPLAALNDSPILLTRDNVLPEETLAELNRLNAKEVVILGGELSVPKHIADTLVKNGFTVTRIGGNNRYTQAELVANEIMKTKGKNRDAFLASGEVFSDALSIATVASNKRLPIFLTRGNRLEQSVLNAIPYVNSWTIIGGELTINKSVEDEMKAEGATVRRIAGRDRYEVNRNVMNFYGTPEDHMYVTSGEHYSDTLPASVLASKEKSGVLLVRNNRDKTIREQKFFAQNQNRIEDFTFIGGPLTLSEETKENFETPITTVNEELLEMMDQQFNEYTLSQYNLRLSDALAMKMRLSSPAPQTDKRYNAFISKDFVDKKTNTVTANLLNVRAGAGVDEHIITQLRRGAKVDIINETDNWYQIDLKQTWVNAKPHDVEYYLDPNNFILSDRQ